MPHIISAIWCHYTLYTDATGICQHFSAFHHLSYLTPPQARIYRCHMSSQPSDATTSTYIPMPQAFHWSAFLSISSSQLSDATTYRCYTHIAIIKRRVRLLCLCSRQCYCNNWGYRYCHTQELQLQLQELLSFYFRLAPWFYCRSAWSDLCQTNQM